MNIKHFIIPVCMSFFPLAGKAQVYSLSQCEKMALENNYNIRNGRLDVESAIQKRKEAFTHYFPSVQGIATYYNANQGLAETTVEPLKLLPPEAVGMLPAEIAGMLPASIPVSLFKNGTVGGVTATQPLFTGGRIINGNRLARIGEDVARLQLQLTEEEVVLQTHVYFWQIVNLREKLQTLSTLEKLLDNLYKDVQTAVKAGLKNRNDQIRVELQMQEMQSKRLKIENGLHITKRALAQFIGTEPNGFDIEYHGTAEYASPASFYADAREAVYNRTEAKLLDRRVDASGLQTGITSGERLPSIAVGGGYLYNDLIGRSNNSGVIYATVSVPISGWWGGSHARRRNKLMEQQAKNERQNAIELMTVEIDKTWNELVESYQQMLLAEKSIESSAENLRIADEFYKAGMIPLTEVLDAQLLFQQSRDAHTDAYSQFQIKLIKYRQITTE